MKYIKSLHKSLIGKDFGIAKETFSRQHESFLSIYLLVRIFYVAVFFLYGLQFQNWSKWLELSALYPLWPVVWVKFTGIQIAVNLIMSFSLLTTLLCILFPEKRIFRLLLFTAMLELIAFNYSFGKIGHSSHAWLIAAFIFVFLPDGRKEKIESSITKTQLYLTTFGAAQVMIMLFYSMSGFWKLIRAFGQMYSGEIHAFSPDAFAYQIANRLLKINTTSLVGNFIIDNPMIGWPIYFFTVYIELFAFIAAFRPSLHRIWGFFLILFHIGSSLTLSIHFSKSILLLALFFICSPFVPAGNRFKRVISNLPLLGFVLGLFTRVIRSVQYSHNRGPQRE